MKQLKVVLTIAVSKETLKENGVTIEEIANDLKVYDDEVVDGVVVQRGSDDFGDTTGVFYLHAPTIESVEVIGDDDNE